MSSGFCRTHLISVKVKEDTCMPHEFLLSISSAVNHKNSSNVKL